MPEVAFVFADALMVRRPWQLWSKSFEPEANTLEICSVLERCAGAVKPVFSAAAGG